MPEKTNRILGIITARGGSKRVPNKNIKDFLGKPLLAWTITVGQKSGSFDRFVLTTDSKEIADIGRKNGVEAPFLRPPELAQDNSSSFSAVKHAVTWLENNDNYRPDWIVLLEPSSPGRQPFHIREVVDLIGAGEPDSIIGIAETPGHFNYLKQLNIDAGGTVCRATDGEKIRNLIFRNQDIPKSYYINSAIYAFKTANLFDGTESLWGDKTRGYVMDEKYSLDIDIPEDWLIAETKMKYLLTSNDNTK